MRILKILIVTWLITVGMSLSALGAGSQQVGATTADSVTAISDTTDNDEDLLDTAATTTTSDFDEGDDDIVSPWELAGIKHHSRWIQNLFDWAALGLGGMAIIFVILLLLSPLLVIILIIWLIIRSGRRKPIVQRRDDASQQAATGDHSAQRHPADAPRDIPRRIYNTPDGVEQKKDRATLHMALGAGIIIFFLIVYSRTFIAVGALLLCYGVGEYINARREERRNNNRND